MSTQGDRLRDRLFDQQVPDLDKLENHRKEIRAMLERNERGLRRERLFVPVFWCFVVLMVVSFSFLAQSGKTLPAGVYFGIGLTFALLIVTGAVELLKHFINRARVEVLKEIKGLELRLLDMEGRLPKQAGSP